MIEASPTLYQFYVELTKKQKFLQKLVAALI